MEWEWQSARALCMGGNPAFLMRPFQSGGFGTLTNINHGLGQVLLNLTNPPSLNTPLTVRTP